MDSIEEPLFYVTSYHDTKRPFLDSSGGLYTQDQIAERTILYDRFNMMQRILLDTSHELTKFKRITLKFVGNPDDEEYTVGPKDQVTLKELEGIYERKPEKSNQHVYVDKEQKYMIFLAYYLDDQISYDPYFSYYYDLFDTTETQDKSIDEDGNVRFTNVKKLCQMKKTGIVYNRYEKTYKSNWTWQIASYSPQTVCPALYSYDEFQYTTTPIYKFVNLQHDFDLRYDQAKINVENTPDKYLADYFKNFPEKTYESQIYTMEFD